MEEGRERGREGGREGEMEGGRDEGREGGREGGRKGGREERREGGNGEWEGEEEKEGAEANPHFQCIYGLCSTVDMYMLKYGMWNAKRGRCVLIRNQHWYLQLQVNAYH